MTGEVSVGDDVKQGAIRAGLIGPYDSKRNFNFAEGY